MTKYTIEEIKTLMELGFTKDDIVKMSTETTTTTKTTKAKKPTGSKAKTTKAKTTKTNGDFDRKLYEAKAQELGCFNYGKVVATVENGKVVRTAKENRELVYKAMGIK